MSANSKQLQPFVHAALQAWGKQQGTPENLLADLLLVQRKRDRMAELSPSSLRLATNQVLVAALDALEKDDGDGARILRLRFQDNQKSRAVAHQLGLNIDRVNRLQRKAIANLTTIILRQETAVCQQRRDEIEATLKPATYSKRLFGIDDLADDLIAKLLAPNTPFLFIITGIGGIGKTALADYVVRQLIDEFVFKDILWLRVTHTHRGEDMPPPMDIWDDIIAQLAQRLCPLLPPDADVKKRLVQVRQALKAQPYLVVVDNLEAMEETAVILPHLQDLAHPSKFLLTARSHPVGQYGVYTVTLNEIPRSSALDFMRHHAEAVNLEAFVQVSNEQLDSIHDKVGGNPLAIKLVIRLAIMLPLTLILADLVTVNTDKIEELYRRIYQQAWHVLSQRGQTLLQMMPMAGKDGMQSEQMAAVSNLSNRDLHAAIQELVQFSLLEVYNISLDLRRYGIHRLTDSFLRTDIIHWSRL